MHSNLSRIRRAGERALPGLARWPRLQTCLKRSRRRLCRARRVRAGAAMVIELDAVALRERADEGYVQALGCLVWAAAADDPRVTIDALCDATVELFACEASARADFVARVLRLSPEALAERGRKIVAYAVAPARAARRVALAEVRRTFANIHGGGRGAALARRAVGLVLDPLNPLAEALPRALELATRAVEHHAGYARLVAALMSAHDAAE